ncbi:MAG: VWA domain-containing protein [Bryobacteraceae bacterium]|nr:VWA domain-containing protein [Bryobacteraceae bacterium]
MAAVSASVVAIAAQQDPDTFKVDVKLVRILATVKDANGRPVSGLDKSELAITDNGIPQKIAIFEKYTAQPLSVSILLDISGSTGKDMKYQTNAVGRFVKTLFSEGNPEDRAALYTFNWQVSREVNWTQKPGRFLDRMRQLKGEAGTAMYDAILLASEELGERPGRHVLIVVTDGGDTVSSTSFHKALESVHAADAVLYSILTIPIFNNAGRNTGGENALAILSETSGGKVFAPGLNALDEAFADILRDLRTQYLIGYYPGEMPLTRDRFHRIEVKPNNHELRVVSRTGYYGDAGRSFESPQK